MKTPTRVLGAAFAFAALSIMSKQAAHAQEKLPPYAASAAKGNVRRAPAKMDKAGYKLIFSDEFKGARLDGKKWIDSYPFGERTHSNNEQEYYATDAVLVEKGLLRFKAERREMNGKPYTSGMATTFGKFSQAFGWFEVRAKFPRGKGLWPAFWLLPESGKAWPPEIDILEILDHEPNIVYMTNHWRTETGTHHEGKGEKFVGPDFSADFHTFALQWTPDELVWYVDGVERYATRDHIPQEKMYVLLNLAVGGDWPGMPNAETPFPSFMDVDYVRVYQK